MQQEQRLERIDHFFVTGEFKADQMPHLWTVRALLP